MAGFDARVQSITGRIHQRVAKFRGYKATYTLVTDLTVAPNTTESLTVFMEATDTEWLIERTNGRLVD